MDTSDIVTTLSSIFASESNGVKATNELRLQKLKSLYKQGQTKGYDLMKILKFFSPFPKYVVKAIKVLANDLHNHDPIAIINIINEGKLRVDGINELCKNGISFADHDLTIMFGNLDNKMKLVLLKKLLACSKDKKMKTNQLKNTNIQKVLEMIDNHKQRTEAEKLLKKYKI